MSAATRIIIAALLLLPLHSDATAQDKETKPTTKARIQDKGKARAGKARPRQRRVNPAMQPVKDDPNLPRVLLIGDSISIGYTVPVRKLMQGKANVHRPLTNCGPTTNGVRNLDLWLGDKKWDVIHFNFGLHDLKFMGPNGENLYDPKKGRPQVSVKDYQLNLDSIARRLRKTGAVVIWRNTTPVPPGARGRVVGDSKKYNEIAARVMKKYNIPTHDMYAFSMPRMTDIMQKANVHYTKDGSEALAKTVVEQLDSALQVAKKKKSATK